MTTKFEMARKKAKTFIDSLKADKGFLPFINLCIIIFCGFFVFNTILGFNIAIALYGFGAGTLLALVGIFAKNTVDWYSGMPTGFHLWTFAILVCMFTPFFLFVYRKAK